MPKNLRKHTKLLVVSDTGMYRMDDEIFAFSPVVTELTALLEHFESITWIGFNRPDQHGNKAYKRITDKRITTIVLQRVGGASFGQKLNILRQYPTMLRVVLNNLQTHSNIHTRAPSHPAFIAMLLSVFFSKNIFWHKYAGSWIDKASFFYELQRRFLRTLRTNSFVTINGNYEQQNSQIISFENPCLHESDRLLGKQYIANTQFSTPLNFCFVGNLNANKGVDQILEAFAQLNSTSIGTLHFVGDSPQKASYIERANNVANPVVFHGFLPKEAIQEIYKQCHFILLPSKSEGFPKVIGEAMNYGCIPIVSDVSCIGDYIKDGENGFLIAPNTSKRLILKIEEALQMSETTLLQFVSKNYKLAEKFTYGYYNQRLMKHIFNSKTHKK